MFIFIQTPDGKLVPNGTGFFVGVRDDQDPKSFFVYLVTAKHIITEPTGGKLFPKVYVRLEKKTGGIVTLDLPIITNGPKQTVYFHPDPTVDLAVIPCLPDEKTINFRILTDDMITDIAKFQELKISEGSEVFFTGLFTPHIGQQKNYSVVRFGRVALVTDEKVDWGGTLMDLYLIESSSYGGNSGSPVFFYSGKESIPGVFVVGQDKVFLAGVMMGAFQDVKPIKAVQTGTIYVSRSNLGIAAVVPAYKLREVLFSDVFKAQRKSRSPKGS